jgi:ABC-2 type transport system permease protein
MARNSFIAWFNKKKLLVIFLLGKIIRYIFYFSFLYFLVSSSNGIAGYSKDQVLFFMATYTLVDTLSQFLFRNVYTFRQLVVSGDFDMLLTKPINPLFRVLAGGPDPIDLITIPPIAFLTLYFSSRLNPDPMQVIFFTVLLINALIIAMCFHIFVVSIGIITLETDNTIMIYRDLTSMGRFPIDIYKEPLKGILTFIVPVSLMMTIPAKGMMGLVTFWGLITSLIFGSVLYILSLCFWKYALTKYTSASS